MCMLCQKCVLDFACLDRQPDRHTDQWCTVEECHVRHGKGNEGSILAKNSRVWDDCAQCVLRKRLAVVTLLLSGWQWRARHDVDYAKLFPANESNLFNIPAMDIVFSIALIFAATLFGCISVFLRWNGVESLYSWNWMTNITQSHKYA